MSSHSASIRLLGGSLTWWPALTEWHNGRRESLWPSQLLMPATLVFLPEWVTWITFLRDITLERRPQFSSPSGQPQPPSSDGLTTRYWQIIPKAVGWWGDVSYLSRTWASHVSKISFELSSFSPWLAFLASPVLVTCHTHVASGLHKLILWVIVSICLQLYEVN